MHIRYAKNDINFIIKNSGPGTVTREYFSLEKNIQSECLILPSNYFYPYPNFLINKFNNVNQFITDETVGIHHWEMSWMKRNIIKRIVKKLISFFIQANN